MPSAMPRKSENEPSVTIRGGISRRVISAAFNAPPRHPVRSARSAAIGMGNPASRHAAPNTIAASAIMEPTERSMPPVMMIGVMASDSRPSSTLRRTISKKFSAVKKFSPMALKMAISRSSTRASAHSPLGNQRSRNGLRSMSGNEICIASPGCTKGVHGDGGENDAAFDGALPIGAESEEGECRADKAEQDDAEDGAKNGSASTGDGDASDYDGRDDLQFKA